MVTEGQRIASAIEKNIRLLIDELTVIPDDALNRPLDIQPSNTLYQLGFHTLGSARFWAVTLAGGRNFHRDRPAEFVSSGAGKPLLSDLGALITEIHATIDALDGDAMEQPASAPDDYRTTGGLGDDGFPLRNSLLHALEHTALHLGHAQITRQLLGYPPVRPD